MTKNFLFFATLRYLLLCFLIFGCSKDIEESVSDFDAQKIENSNLASRISENDKPDIHSLIVLGNKLNNPYSVTNMQAAFNYYNQNVPKSPFKKRVVKATHLYIKILPTNEAHLLALDDLDKSDDVSAPVIQDYPLDYDILEEGDYYVEPKSTTDFYYPAYTVIPVGYQLPSGLPYQVIENLYEPKDEEVDVETVALVFAGWQDDIKADINEELTIEQLPEYLNAAIENQNRLFGTKYTPQGTILVENSDLVTDNMQPLMKAKISIGRSFWWKYTYTDDLGNFTSPKKYRGKVRIRAKWRGNTATIRKTWNEVLGFWVSDHLMTITKGNNNKTKNIMHSEPHEGIFGTDLQGGHLWFKGTIHNGLRKYNDYCDANGVNETIRSANVWAFAKGDSSSTPMLNYWPNLGIMADIVGTTEGSVWEMIKINAVYSGIGLLPRRLRPDQIYQGLNNKKVNNTGKSNTVLIHQLVFHEAGHYSHAKKAGAFFWANVFANELNNDIIHDDPYGNGSQPNTQAADYIALAEGWGTLTEFKITTYYYGKAFMDAALQLNFYNTNNIENLMENFDVYDRPMTANRFDDRSWFLHGIMWDLLDDNPENYVGTSTITHSRRHSVDGVALNNIEDQINIGDGNPYHLTNLFDALNSDVKNACDLRSSIININPGLDNPINQLFISYGYNCGIIQPQQGN